MPDQIALLSLLLMPPSLLAPQGAATPPQEPATTPAKPELPQGLARAIAGYAAKVAASAIFTSGRTLDSVLAEELAADAPLQALARPFLSFDVDKEKRAVTARLLGASATAIEVEGLGCPLVLGVDADALRKRAIATPAVPADDRPWPLGDGAPEPPADGVDRAALQAAIDAAFVEPEGRTAVHTRAVVVVHDGHLIAERYAAGYGSASVLPGWSMTKTWIDALLGLRVRDGALDPEARLPVPEWNGPDDARAQLHLDDLMRMQSGLRWKEDYEAPDSDALRMLFTSGRCGDAAAAQPLAVPPRTEYRYSSGTTNLLCRVLRTTFAQDADYLAFPRARLFAPLGMRTALLEPDASGTFVGSSFGFATARDWARFGQFYLQDGVWNGERLLPEGWVAAARTPTATAPRGGYGRHLWLNAGTAADPGDRPFKRLPRDVFYLSGHEGQYVVCFPTEKIVVVRLGCTKRGGFDLHGLCARVARACGG